LLKQAAEQKDAYAIEACWEGVPSHIKTVPGIANIYFAAMIAAGAGANTEAAMLNQLSRHWDHTLLLLFSGIETGDTHRHLQETEKWLAVYPGDAVLLSVLGKLAIKAQQWEKAEQYLQKSLHIDASVDAYQFLGDVMFAKAENDKACDYYKRALELASSQVLNQAESISA